MRGTFRNCPKLKTVDISGINTTDIISMDAMCLGCSTLTDMSIQDVDVSSLTSMKNIFEGCSNLSNISLVNLDLSGVTSLYRVFYGCNALDKLDLSGTDLSNITETDYMYSGANNITSIIMNGTTLPSATGIGNDLTIHQSKMTYCDISNVNVPGKSLSYMFDGCGELLSVDMSNISDSIEYMRGTFRNCQKLKTVDISGINTTDIISMDDILDNVVLNTDSYSDMLIEFANQPVIQPNISLGDGGSKYNSSGETARNTLTSAPNNWVITDGGLE
jgi:uncharacterized protein YjbI with pentapeptide repeats